MTDKIVEDLKKEYDTRSSVGITKYGTTLEENNTDDFLQHLKEELMDGSLYIQKLQSKEDFGSTQDRINHKMIEYNKLTEIKNNKTIQGLLDLISNLDGRIVNLTSVVEDLINITEANHTHIQLLTSIVSANEIALNNLEKNR